MADHVGGDGIADIGGGAQLPMPTVNEVYVSHVSDIGDLPLDVEVNADDVEYGIVRRISVTDGELATRVSAFNSSI